MDVIPVRFNQEKKILRARNFAKNILFLLCKNTNMSMLI